MVFRYGQGTGGDSNPQQKEKARMTGNPGLHLDKNHPKRNEGNQATYKLRNEKKDNTLAC
jgi:hypothetical protein